MGKSFLKEKIFEKNLKVPKKPKRNKKTRTSKVGAKPKAQKAQSVEILLRTFMKRQKTSEHQNIIKFERRPFSLVRKMRGGTFCTTLDAYSLARFGCYCKLEEVVFVSLELLHFCSEIRLDGN